MKKLLLSLSLIAACLFGIALLGAASAEPTDSTQNESVGIDGIIRSDPPTVAATITTPTNGQVISTLPVRISGLCTGEVLVKVFSNGVFIGSAQCTNGTYSLQADLFSGNNDLIARVYDALDQVGPDSNTVSVTFTQGGFNQSGPRVSLTTSYAKRGANPGETLTWPIAISGGTAPYAVSVDWGDGTTELISRAAAGGFDLKHTYDKAGVYTIIIKATDSGGNSAFLQLVGVGNGALAQDNQADNGATVIRTVYVWWPLIISAVLIMLSFWLGGRNKLETLRRQAEKRINY
jgi:hypothetical protein